MNTEYTYLKFPELDDFLAFVTAHSNTPEIGIVVRQLTGKLDYIKYFVRLTRKHPIAKEILVCDVEIYTGFAHNENPEKLTKLKDETIETIKTKAKEVFRKDFRKEPTFIDAEFQLEP